MVFVIVYYSFNNNEKSPFSALLKFGFLCDAMRCYVDYVFIVKPLFFHNPPALFTQRQKFHPPSTRMKFWIRACLWSPQGRR